MRVWPDEKYFFLNHPNEHVIKIQYHTNNTISHKLRICTSLHIQCVFILLCEKKYTVQNIGNIFYESKVHVLYH